MWKSGLEVNEGELVMSFKFNNAVQRLQPLSGHTVRLILWYLADHANDQGVAYASYETIMRACQIKSRTTINEGLKELEALKILRKIHRPNQCVKYVLDLLIVQSLGLAGISLGESELNVGTLDDTPDSTAYDTTEFPSEGPGVRSTIFPGVSTIERGSTPGDTLSTCIPPVKEIHKETNLVSVHETSFPKAAGETPAPPKLDAAEQKMFEWAEQHNFWKDFTPTISGFRNGCLASDSFRKQFKNAMKKAAKNGDSRSDLHRSAYGIPRNKEEAAKIVSFLNPSKEVLAARAAEDLERQKQRAEEKKRYNAAHTCVHCKRVMPPTDKLTDGFCPDCINHHPVSERHWYYCECDKCIARRAANPPKIKAAARIKEPMFEEDPL
jgi:hypothetical protein